MTTGSIAGALLLGIVPNLVRIPPLDLRHQALASLQKEVRPITFDAAEQLWVGRLTRTLTTIALDGYRDWSGIPQPDPLTVLLLAADSRYAGGCSSPTRMRAKPVASDRVG